tara:strand:+ start:37 stop:555 length:519 start_codon:yes stop_codon:yes gene_type:complete
MGTLISNNIKVATLKSSGGTTAMTIDSSGRVLQPTKPAWFVGKTGSGIVAQNPVVFDDVDVNVGNIYSNSTGKVTIPIAGNYYMFFKILSQNGSVGNGASSQIRINRQPSGGTLATIPHSYQYGNVAASGEYFSLHTAVIATLALNDDITCQVDYEGYFGGGYTGFGGFLIG